jgi:hypothetical protein
LAMFLTRIFAVRTGLPTDRVVNEDFSCRSATHETS